MQDPNADRRRQILSLILARRGFYSPPGPVEPSPQTVTPLPAPPQSGFGKFLGGVGNVFKNLTSGETAANTVGGVFGDPTLGSDVRHQIERVPIIGKPLGWAADVATSPLTLATAGAGGLLGGGIRAATAGGELAGFGRLAASAVEPLVQAPLAARVGADVAMTAAGEGARHAAESAGLPAPVQALAGLAGGLAAGRAVSNTVKAATASLGGLTAQEVEAGLKSADPLDRVTSLLSSATSQRAELDAARSAETRARVAGMRGRLDGISDPAARSHIIASESAGAMPDQAFTLKQQITPEDIQAVHQRLSDYYRATDQQFEERRGFEALNKLFTGQMVQPNELQTLQTALGPKFAGVVANITNPKSLLSFRTAADVIGLPRAVMASFDASMPFRQGAIAWTRKSFWKSLEPMAKAMGSQQYYDTVMHDLATDTHPAVDALRKAGAITGLPTGSLAGQEEAFMTALADNIPGVKQSARGAVVYLNKLRADYAKGIVDKWTKNGIQYGEKDLQDLAHWTSIVTGRGDLPKNLGTLPVLMNSLFFSPRFVSSRLQTLDPRTYMNATSIVRKEMMRDMSGYFGTGMAGLAILGTAAKAGILPDTHVELDPRSTDFGKVRVGETRLDPWAGFQPIARYMAQFLSGQAKNSMGDIVDRNRVTTLMNFGRSKMAPVPSFLVDALTKQSFTGQEVDVTTGAGLDRAAAERLIPLLFQDMADAFKIEGAPGLLAGIPAGVGMGVQTYQSASAIRGAGAVEMFGKPWTKLTGEEQAKVNEAYKDTLARQASPASGSVSEFIDKEDTGLRSDEQQMAAAVASGQMRNLDFTKAMQDRMAERVNRIKGVTDFAGVGEGQAPTLLDKFYGLRDQALVNGVVDYELLDELQANFKDSLGKDDRRIIEERTGFQHTPEVKWWQDARKTIGDSGYYGVRGQAMDKLAPLISRIAPDVKTYNQLIAAQGQASSPAQVALLAAVQKRVDKLTKGYQTIFRAKNPDLDQALALVYGSTPIRLRKR
jgi:hypothetical protein